MSWGSFSGSFMGYGSQVTDGVEVRDSGDCFKLPTRALRTWTIFTSKRCLPICAIPAGMISFRTLRQLGFKNYYLHVGALELCNHVLSHLICELAGVEISLRVSAHCQKSAPWYIPERCQSRTRHQQTLQLASHLRRCQHQCTSRRSSALFRQYSPCPCMC